VRIWRPLAWMECLQWLEEEEEEEEEEAEEEEEEKKPVTTSIHLDCRQ